MGIFAHPPEKHGSFNYSDDSGRILIATGPLPVLMLTAHALSEESLKKSAEDGAAYFAPKEKMIDIEIFVGDILRALEMKKSTWEKWLDRLGSFYDSRFQGTSWRENEKEFWEKKIKTRF